MLTPPLIIVLAHGMTVLRVSKGVHSLAWQGSAYRKVDGYPGKGALRRGLQQGGTAPAGSMELPPALPRTYGFCSSSSTSSSPSSSSPCCSSRYFSTWRGDCGRTWV